MAWFIELTDRESIVQTIASSRNARDALAQLGLPYTQRTRDALAAACQNYGIALVFPDRFVNRRMDDEEIFVENSTYVCNSRVLKRRFLKITGLPDECVICGQGPVWNGLPISLQLDHENGVNNDHRLVNLRILCPNCHTQTPTYAGKRRGDRTVDYVCALPSCRRSFTPIRVRASRPPTFCSVDCYHLSRRKAA